MFTLKEWKQIHKDTSNIIVNASHINEQDDFVPWPIGMCYHFHGYKNQLEKSDFNLTVESTAPDLNLVISSFSTDTDQRRRGSTSHNRKTIEATLLKAGIKNIGTKPFEFYEMLPNYKFVISPEGNGIDCHRHYEALWFGCIPIIEESEMIKQKYGNVPILYTEKYTEINNEYLIKKYNEMLNQTFDFSRLFLNSYTFAIQDQIILCSRYWTIRFYGQVYYDESYSKFTNTIPDPEKDVIISSKEIQPLSIFNPVTQFNWRLILQVKDIVKLIANSKITFPPKLRKTPYLQNALTLNYNIYFSAKNV